MSRYLPWRKECGLKAALPRYSCSSAAVHVDASKILHPGQADTTVGEGSLAADASRPRFVYTRTHTSRPPKKPLA